MDIREIRETYGEEIARIVEQMARGDRVNIECANDIISAIDDYDDGSICAGDDITWGTDVHTLYYVEVAGHGYLIEDTQDGYAIIDGPATYEDYLEELAEDRVRRLLLRLEESGSAELIAYWTPAEGSTATAYIRLYCGRGRRLRARVEYGTSDRGTMFRRISYTHRPQYYDVRIQEAPHGTHRQVERGTMVIAPDGIYLPDMHFPRWEEVSA